MRPLVGALLVAVAACRESVTAPGLCPEFCLAGGIETQDTVLASVIAAESSFVGYRFPQQAFQLQAGGPASGSTEARILMTFGRFAETFTSTDTSVSKNIIATDSFQISFAVVRRSAATGLALRLHRLGIRPDSSTTWDETAGYFADSAFVGSLVLPDTLQSGPVSVVIPASAFPSFAADSFRIALGIRLADPAFVSLAAADSSFGSILTRFIRVDSAGTRVTRVEVRVIEFDTFLGDPAGLAGGFGLRVGGLPAARVLLRASVPQGIVDSTQVVRATLLLVPAQPAIGAAGDTIRLRVHGIGADFGAKSPIITEVSDTSSVGSALVPVGTMDTIRIDVTHVFQNWRLSPTLPRAMMLRVVPEAVTVGALDLLPSTSPAGRPSLHVTYIPRYRFPGR